MLKLLLSGIALGAGLVAGVAGVVLGGWLYFADDMKRADAQAIAGLERANAAIEEAFPAPRVRDDLEAYRACLHANDTGNAETAVDACRDEFRDWEDSPTFALELEKLQNMDSRVLEIMAAYDNANPTRYFD